jgi:hypothetical protein
MKLSLPVHFSTSLCLIAVQVTCGSNEGRDSSLKDFDASATQVRRRASVEEEIDSFTQEDPAALALPRPRGGSNRNLQYYGGYYYGDQVCTEDEILVSVELLTDWYAKETYWEIVRDVDDMIFLAGFGLTNSQAHYNSICLPKNCYTFKIYDSKGDGICCDYGLGKVSVQIGTGSTLEDTIFTESDFGYNASVSFGGECSPIPDYPKTKCVNLTYTMTPTGEYPYVYLTLYDLNSKQMGINYWGDVYFDLPNATNTATKCIDPTTCYEVRVDDYSLELNGEMAESTLTYNGNPVELSPETNHSFVALVGDCAGRPPCVDLSVSLTNFSSGLEISFADLVTGSPWYFSHEGPLYELTKCVDPLRCYEIMLWECYRGDDGSSSCSSVSSEDAVVVTYNGTTMPTNFSYYSSYYVGDGCNKLGYGNTYY